MPRDAAGRWYPPPEYYRDWDDFAAKFRQRVAFEHLDNVDTVLRHCGLCGRNPSALHREWVYWVTGAPDMERWPLNWPPCMTAKDWDSFALFVANETAAERAKIDIMNSQTPKGECNVEAVGEA